MPRLQLSKTTKIVGLLISMVLIIGSILLLYSKTIPKLSVTIYRFSALKSEIIYFTRKNNKPPDSLSDLAFQGFDRSILTDAWKQPIEYRLNTNYEVTLRSYGPRQLKS